MKYKIKGKSLTMTLSQEEIVLIVDALETATLVETEKTEHDDQRSAMLADCIASFREFQKEEYA